MKPRPDLNLYSKEVHNLNIEKGFHQKDWSNEHCLCLVISEFMEAIEADRKGFKIDKDHIGWAFLTDDRFDNTAYDLIIKGSVEEELADAVLRLLDLAGLRGVGHLKNVLLCPTVSEKKSFTENIFAITIDLVYYKYSISERIAFALLNIEKLCQLLNIDLWLHVDLKFKYNKTRPAKHGKEY